MTDGASVALCAAGAAFLDTEALTQRVKLRITHNSTVSQKRLDWVNTPHQVWRFIGSIVTPYAERHNLSRFARVRSGQNR